VVGENHAYDLVVRWQDVGDGGQREQRRLVFTGWDQLDRGDGVGAMARPNRSYFVAVCVEDVGHRWNRWRQSQRRLVLDGWRELVVAVLTKVDQQQQTLLHRQEGTMRQLQMEIREQRKLLLRQQESMLQQQEVVRWLVEEIERIKARLDDG